jgi:hypothetical protein
VDGVNFVSANGIMQDTGGNSFSPRAAITREASIVAFNNIRHRDLPATPPQYAPDRPGIEINGKPVAFPDQQPIIENGRTIAPIRAVFEAMGFTAGWDPELHQGLLRNNEYTIVVTEGSYTFTVNGTSYDFEIPARIVDGQMMAQIGALLQSVGCALNWDADRYAVEVTLPVGMVS